MNTERATEQLHSLSEQIQDGIKRGSYSVGQIQEMLVDKTKAAAKVSDEYVHDNPWKMIGIAAALGVVLGLLMSKSSDRSHDEYY